MDEHEYLIRQKGFSDLWISMEWSIVVHNQFCDIKHEVSLQGGVIFYEYSGVYICKVVTLKVHGHDSQAQKEWSADISLIHSQNLE